MNSNIKTLLFWVILVSLALLLFVVVRSGQGRRETAIDFTDFMSKVNEQQVKHVTISTTTGEVHGDYRSSDTGFSSQIPVNYPSLYDTLQAKGVDVKMDNSSNGGWVSMLVNISPFIVLLAFWIFMMRQMQSGGNKALSFGKSRARLHSTQQKKVTFKDVAGVEEAKEELQEIIEFLREPQKFQKLGGRIPKGVLLIGPPGTGKTLLARAIAGEASVPFFSISGSDFVEMFVGVGASRVRDLFEQGKKNAPCIVFIDEIDAVGRHRGAGLGGGHDEREQTLNALLVEMDGFEANTGVIIIAATNRPDVLDPALLRAGRFDRQVVVNKPDIKGREGILKVHSRDVKMEPNVDMTIIAKRTSGFSGADLANLVNESALLAARKNKKAVSMEELEESIERVVAGPEKKSRLMSEKENNNTAYHEAGHAIVTRCLPDTDPVHKISIIPRGMALGYTLSLPLEDKHSYKKSELVNTITIFMGGRSAEEIVFTDYTTGAANDIERATSIAHRMVCELGMSDKLGALSWGKSNQEVFIGKDFMREKNYSEDTAQKIDAEVKSIIDGAHTTARAILKKNRKFLDTVAKTLLEKETIEGEEFERMYKEFAANEKKKKSV